MSLSLVFVQVSLAAVDKRGPETRLCEVLATRRSSRRCPRRHSENLTTNLEIVDPADNPGTCASAGQTKVLIENHAGLRNIGEDSQGFLSFHYGLFDCRLKSPDLTLKTFDFRFQFASPFGDYPIHHWKLNRSLLARLSPESPALERKLLPTIGQKY